MLLKYNGRLLNSFDQQLNIRPLDWVVCDHDFRIFESACLGVYDRCAFGSFAAIWNRFKNQCFDKM